MSTNNSETSEAASEEVLSPHLLKHFQRQVHEFSWFWPRFGGTPNFEGKRVLDIGCGLGALCLDIAGRGAESVVGVEINDSFVDFARAHLASRNPEHLDVVSFHCGPLSELGAPKFDYIVSKDVFEHVLDIEALVPEMLEQLAEGGRIYLGFGPLWYSPFGDHKLSRKLLPGQKWAIPWGHLFVSEKRLLRGVKVNGVEATSIKEYGLNKRPPQDYERILRSTGLEVEYYKTNVSTNPLARAASLMCKIPFLRKYFVSTVYCILKK